MRCLLFIIVICVATTSLVTSGFCATSEQRFYAGAHLAEAREAMKTYSFRDEKLGDAFSLNNSRVVALLFELIREEGSIKELKVSANNRGESNLNLLAVLDDRNNPDFKALVTRLKL